MNSMDGLRISSYVFLFAVLGFSVLMSFSKVDGDALVAFQEKCDKDNGVVISSTKGLTCIQKEAVLFFEK